MEFNLADLFEAAVDTWPDREYVVAEGQRLTYRQLEERANRLAHHLAAQGVRKGEHVGIYALNSAEWVTTAWAVFKLRAVWVNINYRYVHDELSYLFKNADLVALVHQRQFSPRVAALLPELPALRHVVVIDDDSQEPDPSADAVDFEQALASASPERDFAPRSGDDIYILYTGGTTGMPKGVVWRHEDVFFALGGGIDAMTGVRMQRPEQMVEKGLAAGGPLTFLPIAPLMHGATQWGVMGQSFTGNRVVLVAKFDPHEVWSLVEREKVNMVMITGDAMGKPMIEALDEPGAAYDLSSLIGFTSTAALFSPAVKDEFFRHFPNLIMTDAIGSSESGNNGITRVQPGATAMKGGPTVTAVGESVVLDDALNLVKPGSGVVGKIARAGDIPIGYYNDPKKTAEVFITVDGRRFVMPGDFATIEADGSVTLLGRGSICINSGGEKIFPEEVEAVVRNHPDVMDAIVVGAPDERFGQRVAAIVEPRSGHSAPSLEAVQEHCRGHVAGYKVPRQLHVVDKIERSPSGKPDYRWANSIVTTEAGATYMPVALSDLVGTGQAAVVTMELQRGVVGDLSSFPALADEVERIGVVPATARLLRAARRSGVPVVHCTAGFRADRLGSPSNAPLMTAVLRRPEHLLEQTAAVELMAELGAESGDLVSHRRHGVSPFVGTTLDPTLRALGVSTVVATGVSLNLGIIGLAVEAVDLGYHVVLATDAVAGIPSDYAADVVRHTLALIATLATVDDIIGAFGP